MKRSEKSRADDKLLEFHVTRLCRGPVLSEVERSRRKAADQLTNISSWISGCFLLRTPQTRSLNSTLFVEGPFTRTRSPAPVYQYPIEMWNLIELLLFFRPSFSLMKKKQKIKGF